MYPQNDEDIRSVGPSQPEMMGLPTSLGLWIFVSVKNIGILGGLGVCKGHFLVMSSMCSPWCNRLMRSLTFSCLVFTIVALRRSSCFLLSSCTLASYILSALFMITVVVPLSAFLRFIAGLFFNSFTALTSLRDRLFLGLVILISASCVLTFSK